MAQKRHVPTTKHDVEIARISASTKIRLIDRGAGVFRTGLRWTGTVWAAIELKEAIGKIVEGHIALGGILMSLISERPERWILGSLAAICAAVAVRERGARRRVTKTQAERIRELEAKIDPERSSSRLLADGRARKDDHDDEP